MMIVLPTKLSCPVQNQVTQNLFILRFFYQNKILINTSDDGDDEDDALATQNGSSDEDDMSLTLRCEVALAHEASTTTTRLQVATPEPSTARGNIPLVWTNTDRISCNVPVWKRQLPSESSVRLPMKYFRKLFDKDRFTHILRLQLLHLLIVSLMLGKSLTALEAT